MAKQRKSRKAKQKNASLVIGVLAALLIISIGYIAYFSYFRPSGTQLSVGEILQAPSGESYFSPPAGFVEQNVFRVEGLQTIVIGRDCTAIVADTSPERAEAIREGLTGRVAGRPTAYDQWADLLLSFGISFEAVTIHGFEDDAYISTGVFRQGSAVLEQDMRPSDALALAARTSTRIYLKQSLLQLYGEDIC